MQKVLALEQPKKSLSIRFYLWRLKRKHKMPLWYLLNESLLINTHEWEWFQVTEDGEIGILQNKRAKTRIFYEFLGGEYYLNRLVVVTDNEKWEQKDMPKSGVLFAFRILGMCKLPSKINAESIQSRDKKISNFFEK